MPRRRQDHEPLAAVAERGWRYHHVGIPTTRRRRGEVHLRDYGLFVSGFSTSPYGIEWMRFENTSPVSEIIRTVPHVAFAVDDLDAAVKNCTLLGRISSPSKGVRVAMILHNGAPVELLEFRRGNAPGSRRRHSVTGRRPRAHRRRTATHGG